MTKLVSIRLEEESSKPLFLYGNKERLTPGLP